MCTKGLDTYLLLRLPFPELHDALHTYLPSPVDLFDVINTGKRRQEFDEGNIALNGSEEKQSLQYVAERSFKKETIRCCSNTFS